MKEKNGINDFDISDNFNLREFQCKCCQCVKIHSELVRKLQRLRKSIKSSIIVTSGYRCERHNREVGGAVDSKHLYGLAADIMCNDISKNELFIECMKIGFSKIIWYRDLPHIHVEV